MEAHQILERLKRYIGEEKTTIHELILGNSRILTIDPTNVGRHNKLLGAYANLRDIEDQIKILELGEVEDEEGIM